MAANTYTPYNLVLGPADLYLGTVGTTEPIDGSVATAPGTGWTGVGATDGGVIFEIDGTYTDLNVDQIIMSVGSRLTELKATVTTQLSEITLTNLNSALNNIGTYTAGVGGTAPSTLDVLVGSSSTQPTYTALIIDGWAPATSAGAAMRRRIIVRKALSQPKAKLNFDKKTQQSIEVSWNVLYVGSATNPIHIVDQES